MSELDDEQRLAEIFEMTSPAAIRNRVLRNRELAIALVRGDDMSTMNVREGGGEEMLRLLGLRAPLPELSGDEIAAWRSADAENEALYLEYQATSKL